MAVLAPKWVSLPTAKRWGKMETLYTSVCLNPSLLSNHKDRGFALSAGAHRGIWTVKKVVGQPWASTISHDRMQKLCTAMGNYSSPSLTQSWGQSPCHDALQGMMESIAVSVFCLQFFLRTNKALPLAATQNIAQLFIRGAACSRSGRGKDKTPWILDSCSQGSINPTHLKVRHLLEVSLLGFLCSQ